MSPPLGSFKIPPSAPYGMWSFPLETLYPPGSTHTTAAEVVSVLSFWLSMQNWKLGGKLRSWDLEPSGPISMQNHF